jgi:hypothetical protein
MSERVLPLHPNVHRMVDALLPWHVNGTLEGEERDLVVRHLEECGQCRREVEWLRGLHAACVACAAEDEGSPVFDVLRRRRKPWWRSTPVWGIAAAAQLAVIGLLGWRVWSADETSAQYRTLASEGGIASGDVVVVFDAAAPEAQMRRLLQASGARIVGGPTAANGYVLAIPPDARARALEQLRAAKIVKLAEPLGNRDTP